MAKEYVYNQVFRGALTGRIYFAPKATVLRAGDQPVLRVIGKKIDITDQVNALFAKPNRRAPKKTAQTRGK